MKKKCLFFLVSLMTLASQRTSANCPHLIYGMPHQSDMVTCREGYSIGYSFIKKSAEWVSYRLDRQAKGGGVERTDDFRVDPLIPQQYQTTPADYDEPIYHQGHLANSESIDVTHNAMSETFFMSNMIPQLPKHNTGIWKGLENRERKWANRYGTVFVFSGPLYQDDISYIGNRVPVPSHLWKIIFNPSKQKAIAYLIDHKPLLTRDLDNYLTSIDHIESITGFNFLENLPDDQEISVEKSIAKKQW